MFLPVNVSQLITAKTAIGVKVQTIVQTVILANCLQNVSSQPTHCEFMSHQESKVRFAFIPIPYRLYVEPHTRVVRVNKRETSKS